MATRRYKWKELTQEQLAEIEKKYPKAVQSIKVPVYSIITKLLDCGQEIPGLVLVDDEHVVEDVTAEKKARL